MAWYIDCDKCYHGRVCAYRHHYHDMIVECNHHTPTADVVEVKHGEWKMNFGRGYGEKLYFCSLCVEGDSDTGHDNYCPSCGAKMDGRSDA